MLNLHAGHDLYVVTLKRAVKNKKKNANAVKLCNVLKPDVSVDRKFMYWTSHNAKRARLRVLWRPKKHDECMFGFVVIL